MQELIVTFPSSTVNICYLEIAFFHQLSLHNLDLKIRNSLTFSAFKKGILKFKRSSSNSIFNCHIPNGIKLITTLLIQFAVVTMASRHQFITYFIVQIIYMKGWHTWTTFKMLAKTFMIKMIPNSRKSFYLVFLQTMMYQIHVIWML